MNPTAPPREEAPDQHPNSFETIDGELVLYDRTNPEAWIQSSVSIDFEAVWANQSA